LSSQLLLLLLLLDFAKACKQHGRYDEAVKAYERANDTDQIVELKLRHLDQVQQGNIYIMFITIITNITFITISLSLRSSSNDFFNSGCHISIRILPRE